MRTRMLRYVGHAFAIKCLFVVALGLAWSPAILAQTVTNYTGTYCRPMLGNAPGGNDDASRITYVNGAVKNISAQDVTVFCPIVKHTSNPGFLGNDQINSIAITSTGNAGFTCTLNVYETAPYFTDGPFLEDSQSVDGPGPGTYYVSSSASDYWGDPPQSSGDNSYWAYAELNCTLHPGTAITHYSVDEAGKDQGRRIVPSSYCYPTPNVKNPAEYLRWFSVYNSDPNEPVNTTGGYVESMSFPLGKAFSFDCPLSKLNLAHVQIALGPAIGGQFMGCDLDGNNGTWQGAPFLGMEFQVGNLVFSSSGHNRLTCTINTQPANAGQGASQGDGKIVSYRMW